MLFYGGSLIYEFLPQTTTLGFEDKGCERNCLTAHLGFNNLNMAVISIVSYPFEALEYHDANRNTQVIAGFLGFCTHSSNTKAWHR